jgi:hypothetical protein
MKWWVGLALAGAVLAAPASPGAWAGACPARTAAPEVTLRLEAGEPLLDHSYDRGGVKRVSDAVMGYTQGPWHVPLGLTLAKLLARYKTSIVYAKGQGGTYCVYLDSAEIAIGYPEVQVFVSSDYPEASCEYQAVLAHEMEHVAVNRQVLDAHEAPVRKALARILRSKRSLVVYNKSSARAAFIREFELGLKAALAALAADHDRLNAKIDSESSYRRVFEQCSDW